MDECRRTEWAEQQAMIERSAAYWDWARICVDATGLGAVPSQLLRAKLGTTRVEPSEVIAQMWEPRSRKPRR